MEEERKITAICEMMQDRVHVLPEIMRESVYLSRRPEGKECELPIIKSEKKAIALRLFADLFVSGARGDVARLKTDYLSLLKENDIKVAEGMQALRVCLTGRDKGPDLFKIISYLGAEETLRRVRRAAYL